MSVIAWLLLALSILCSNLVALALGTMAARGERRVIGRTTPQTKSLGSAPRPDTVVGPARR